MLKRFTVENFSSYQGENSLDLTAGRTELHQNHVVDFKKVKILKSAIIYGANASGKSNLIKAIEYGKNVILKGLNNVDTYKKYFRLDENSSKEPTYFEYELEIDNEFFSYGFNVVLNSKSISEEWLYKIGKSNPEMIFERKNSIIEYGKILKQDKIKSRFEIYSDDMKNQTNQLFLSEIANKDLDIKEVDFINNIYTWFDEKLIILYPHSKYGGISSLDSNKSLSKIFKKHLNEFDTGIIDIESFEEDFEKSLKGFPEEIKKDIEKSLSKKDVKVSLSGSNGELLTIYKDSDNELKVRKLGLLHSKEYKEIFELKDESDGTRRLFDLIPLITKFSQDYTIIIDEFDRSLHPKLTKNFFELFYKLNDLNTQLIITTHESGLLDLDLLRRDEIWFAEKDKNGASKLFSLNQFKVRYDSKIEKAYLLGRYGAIPIFKTFDELELDN